MVCGGNVAQSLSDNFGLERHTTAKLTDHRGGTATTCYDFTPTYNIVELKKFPAAPIQTGPVGPINPSPPVVRSQE
jgi:hypothetical protein